MLAQVLLCQTFIAQRRYRCTTGPDKDEAGFPRAVSKGSILTEISVPWVDSLRPGGKCGLDDEIYVQKRIFCAAPDATDADRFVCFDDMP